MQLSCIQYDVQVPLTHMTFHKYWRIFFKGILCNYADVLLLSSERDGEEA